MERVAEHFRDAAERGPDDASAPSPATGRRPYAAPRLTVYGRVSDLTRTVGRRGRRDSRGRRGGRRRTGF